jgi:predicted glycosyltransferase involved in capsule biosynthesis
MKDVGVVIPWRDVGCPHRNKAFDFIVSFYKSRFSEIILCDSGSKVFNRAASRNRGVEACSSEIIVVADSDLFTPMSQIVEGIHISRNYYGQVRPFTTFGHMSKASTDYFLNQNDFNELSYEKFQNLSAVWPGVHGGIFIMQKKLWLSVGGMDENFSTWGGEDNAFNIRCENRLNNPVKTVDGYAMHLFHPYQRRISRENYLRLESYMNGILL